MQVVFETGKADLAKVYIGQFPSGRRVEFTESLQPPLPIDKKWILTISTLAGCPVGCPMCDAGDNFAGKLNREEIFSQIDFLVQSKFPTGKIPCQKFKIQLARMGEPSFNPHVLSVIEELPARYRAPGLLLSLSSVAPAAREEFFAQLSAIKDRLYKNGNFQLQFSIHTTDSALRDKLIPIKKWNLAQIADFGQRFCASDKDRKVTLNFALAAGYPCDAKILQKYFDPEKFLLKITPLNPTVRASENRLKSFVDTASQQQLQDKLAQLRRAGFEVLLCIGEREENKIGSNCGQYLKTAFASGIQTVDSYLYRDCAFSQPVSRSSVNS